MFVFCTCIVIFLTHSEICVCRVVFDKETSNFYYLKGGGGVCFIM